MKTKTTTQEAYVAEMKKAPFYKKPYVYLTYPVLETRESDISRAFFGLMLLTPLVGVGVLTLFMQGYTAQQTYGTDESQLKRIPSYEKYPATSETVNKKLSQDFSNATARTVELTLSVTRETKTCTGLKAYSKDCK
jgi:hypothetical protein